MNMILEALVEIDESLGVKKRVRDGGKSVNRRWKFSKLKNKSYNNSTKKKRRLTKSDRLALGRVQKKAALKRKSSKSLASIKRKKSMRKRKSIGFDK